MWYDIDYAKLVFLLTPSFLRKPRTLAFLVAFSSPIARLHYLWKQQREAHWYQLNHTGQVFSLTKVLNDQCDNELRRITLSEGDSFARTYAYTTAENKPIFLGKKYLRQSAEYYGTGVDFIVLVPPEVLETKKYELERLINFYRLASKRFQIQPIA